MNLSENNKLSSLINYKIKRCIVKYFRSDLSLTITKSKCVKMKRS